MRLSPHPPNALLEQYCSKGTVPLTHTPRAPPGVGGFNWPAATAADPEKKRQSTQMISTRELRGGGIDGMNFNCVQT